MLLQWQFKKIRLKEQKKLNETNLYLYKAITIYIQNSNLRAIEKEEILQQIMDMMLQAQIENRSVDLIIGQDYEKFCESIIEEYGSSKNILYNVLNCMQKYLIWMISISLSMALLNGITVHSFNLGNINQFMVVNVIALIIIPASKKEKQKNSSIFYLPQKLYAMNRDVAYPIILILLVYVMLKFILEKILDCKIFSYTITFYKALPYMLIIILMIISIEIYKRIYDREVVV